MTDQEKKDALLKFAGFTYRSFDYKGDVYQPHKLWETPEGWCMRTPPDLLHSLDVQAKWIDPLLDNWSLSTYDTHVTAIVHCGTSMGTADAPKDRPAEAKAEATLSLIGEENED